MLAENGIFFEDQDLVSAVFELRDDRGVKIPVINMLRFGRRMKQENECCKQGRNFRHAAKIETFLYFKDFNLNTQPDYFQVPARDARDQLSEKRSRFICYALKVRDEAEIRERLAEIRREHPSANHHCYAWRLGADGEKFRMNDDGEPSGSAGRPIYGEIQSRKISDVLLVVVRYFGGIQLGVRGLINAYRGVASSCLDKAGTAQQAVIRSLVLRTDPANLPLVMNLLKKENARIREQNYLNEKMEIRIEGPPSVVERVITSTARFVEVVGTEEPGESDK